MSKSMNLMKAAIGSAVCVLAMTGLAAQSHAAVEVNVSTPDVRVQVGNPAPPPPVFVRAPERVIAGERDEHHDRGRHKGHYKHKKHKKHHD